MRRWRTYLSVVAAGAAVVLLVWGHVLHKPWAQSVTEHSGIRVERIAVMPLLKGRCGTEMRETLDCPVAKLSFDSQNLSGGCDQIVMGYVHEAIQKRHGVKVVPLEEAKEVYRRMVKDEATDTLRTTAQNFGRAVGANLIMVGTIWRYRERVGSPAAVQSPASVAFAIGLIDVTNGKMLWKGRFAETQASLSDNILDVRAFLKKGGKWLSASELARYGVTELFKKYPV